MEMKSYVITLDEKNSFIGVTPAFGSRYDYVTVSKPVSVALLDDNPKALAQLIQNSCKNQKLYTEEALEKARQDGQNEGYANGFTFGRNEVWNIMHDILFDPDYGTDFMIFGGWNSQSDIFNDTYEHVHEVVQRWRGLPKRFDIVKVQFGDDKKEAIITQVDGDQVDLMFKGGRTCRRYISAVTKTGRTLEYGLLKWMKGEE
jgi:hypothetical protein